MQKTRTVSPPLSLLTGLVLGLVLTACNKAPLYSPPSTKTTGISEFWLERTKSNPALNRPYQGMIMGDTAIRLVVDYGTDITALEPTIFADADSISPKGKQNFSTPVRYTVWAAGNSAVYTVRMTVSPVQTPTIKAIAAGYSHIMALKTDGTVWVCGNNFSGQLGLGDYSSRNRLTQVPVYDAVEIVSGEAASIIRLNDGTTWGAGNQYGQLGLGHKRGLATLTRTPFLDEAVQLAFTFSEVFALKRDGTVWGAGRNATKILAQGDDELRASFVKIPINGVKQISGCGSDIIVQKTNGEVWGWGDNFAGELGLGDQTRRTMPTLLASAPAGVAKIFAGGNSTFLLDNDGKVWATGVNASGQLGLGDKTNRSSFTQVPFFDNKSIEAIMPHLSFTSFKESSGAVWNVGDNVRGQMGLGNYSTLPYLTPVQMPGFTANVVAGNGSAAFALKPDGSLWAWGSNSSGTLGTGKADLDSPSPIQLN